MKILVGPEAAVRAASSQPARDDTNTKCMSWRRWEHGRCASVTRKHCDSESRGGWRGCLLHHEPTPGTWSTLLHTDLRRHLSDMGLQHLQYEEDLDLQPGLSKYFSELRLLRAVLSRVLASPIDEAHEAASQPGSMLRMQWGHGKVETEKAVCKAEVVARRDCQIRGGRGERRHSPRGWGRNYIRRGHDWTHADRYSSHRTAHPAQAFVLRLVWDVQRRVGRAWRGLSRNARRRFLRP
jgi:hypothetical protein